MRTRLWLILGLVWLGSGCDPAPPALPVAKTAPTVTVPVVPMPAATAPAQPSQKGRTFTFRDATEPWGLTFRRYDDMQGQNRILEVNGGGAGLFDYDLDGRLDLFLTQGNTLPRGTVSPQYSNEFYRNSPSGRLEHLTAQTRLTAHGFFTGCAVGDYDADGFPDLYVGAYGLARMWRNNGDGTFEEITQSSGAGIDSWTTSVLFADLNGDQWLDLYIPTYVVADDVSPRLCTNKNSPTGTVQCPSAMFDGLEDVLLINDGQGGFLNVTQTAGIVGPDGKGLGAVATDVNGDGWLDLYIANDGTPCFLYLNTPLTAESPKIPGTEIALPRFREQGTESGVAVNREGKATAAMGIAHGDYDRDDWIDLLVTNFHLETNTLYHNSQGEGFQDWSSPSRLGPPSRETLAFGTEFVDVDNDGWLDLVVSTGHIEDRTWIKGDKYHMRPHLFRNDRNGKFTDVAATAGDYFTREWVGRGLAVGDIDRDGDLDLIMAQQIDHSAVVINETPQPQSSVIIKPIGRQSPRSGIGVQARALGVTPVLLRDVAGGSSFQSASAQELHLGLGDQPEFAELELRWPGGQVDVWPNVAAGYYLAIEGQGLVPVPHLSP